MVETIKIYCLRHPDTLELRYVGMTSKSLKYRLGKHIDNAKYTKHNKHLCNWILAILKLGKLPIIELIEEVNNENWIEKEVFYIKKYKSDRLLNFTNGGEGVFGLKHSEESKKKMSDKVKLRPKPSEETLLKRSLALKGRIVTSEHRAKIGKANSGKIYTKYKILIIDLFEEVEYVFPNIQVIPEKLPISWITVRRNLSGNIVKNRFFIVKI